MLRIWHNPLQRMNTASAVFDLELVPQADAGTCIVSLSGAIAQARRAGQEAHCTPHQQLTQALHIISTERSTTDWDSSGADSS